MNTIPGLILLQGSAPPQSPLGGFLVPMVLVFAIFYFLVIRPQAKRQKEHDATLKGIEKGDRVVTSGGIHGTVTGTTDDTLTVEIAALKGERVRIKVARAKIDTVAKVKGENGS